MLDLLLSQSSLPVIVLGLLAAGVGAPIPEDVMLLAAGVVAHRTWWPWYAVLPIVYVAALGADALLFLAARHFGERWLTRRPLRWLITPARRAHVQTLFARYGATAVFFGRHMTGLRAVVFATAGLERMPVRQFLFWDGLAGVVTIPLMFSLGYFFSAHLQAVEANLARVEHWVGAALALAVLILWLAWPRIVRWRAPQRRDDPPHGTPIK